MERCVHKWQPLWTVMFQEEPVMVSEDTSDCMVTYPTLAATAGSYEAVLSRPACVESKPRGTRAHIMGRKLSHTLDEEHKDYCTGFPFD
jgi:hypothetical protein